MSEAHVVKAEFVDYKTVRTRSTLQLVLEVPIEQQAEIFAKLGYPLPGQNKWVAVALLDELVVSETERQQKAKAESRSLAGKERYANSGAMEKARTRAVLLAKDPQFQMWCGYRDEEAAAFIRRACAIASRRYIATDRDAYDAFLRLEGQFAEATGRLAENRGSLRAVQNALAAARGEETTWPPPGAM